MCVHQVRSRGLPDDHAGPIRIIDIEGVDANMCCGTHVSNLSHLQVKILNMHADCYKTIYKSQDNFKMYMYYFNFELILKRKQILLK